MLFVGVVVCLEHDLDALRILLGSGVRYLAWRLFFVLDFDN